MIELNKGQKIAGYIFVVIISFVSLVSMADNHYFAGIIGFAIAAGLVIWCLYRKPK